MWMPAVACCREAAISSAGAGSAGRSGRVKGVCQVEGCCRGPEGPGGTTTCAPRLASTTSRLVRLPVVMNLAAGLCLAWTVHLLPADTV